MGKKQTLLLADDHLMFREGLALLLSGRPEYEIVGEAGDGETAVRKAGECRPDIVIMDISLPDISGIDATRRIRKCLPQTRVVILSMHAKVEYITSALKAGASGYITKDAASDQLLECLETVRNGEFYMDPAVSHKVMRNILINDQEERAGRDGACEPLTGREQDVARALAQGLPVAQIAENLSISEKTVQNYRSILFKKLNIASMVELVRYAARNGLIDLDQWKR